MMSQAKYYKNNYTLSTKNLIQLLKHNSELELLLRKSIQKARVVNPNPNSNPIKNIDDYFQFISYCERAMPWQFLPKKVYDEIFNNTFQSLCLFYFLIDQTLDELSGKGYFNNTLQYHPPFAEWLITFVQSWGNYLDSEESWNKSYLDVVLNDKAFGLQNGWYENPGNWRTFNQFFARNLSSSSARPIVSPDEDSVVVSFADSKPQGTWSVDGASNIISENGIAIKSSTILSVQDLLGNSEYRDSFANGTLTHSFLNINDYHRYHFPVSGIVKEVRIIQSSNPAGGRLSWDAKNNRYSFDPSSIGWQSLETRGCVTMETSDYGLVALLPIGMGAVGSVNFEDHIAAGTQVKKGDMLGYFLFGGSDFILLFQSCADFQIELPIEGSTYKHVLMGEKLGRIKKAIIPDKTD